VIEGVSGCEAIWTMPGHDVGAAAIRAAIPEAVSPDWQGYLDLMAWADVMVGNSSSGLIEAGLFRLPVINVGQRQAGRLAGSNVIRCAEVASEIRQNILVSQRLRVSLESLSLYGDGHAAPRIAGWLGGHVMAITAGRSDATHWRALTRFYPIALIPVARSGRDTSPKGIANDLGSVLRTVALLIEDVRPDMVCVFGDRFEQFAAATAAHLASIPILHISGGDRTLGSYDDAFRDAISRMAAIHCVAHETARQRLLQLGGDPACIHVTGLPGLDLIREYLDSRRD
jgi:UDP-N-acetylglucosamine 2-epimerase